MDRKTAPRTAKAAKAKAAKVLTIAIVVGIVSTGRHLTENEKIFLGVVVFGLLTTVKRLWNMMSAILPALSKVELRVEFRKEDACVRGDSISGWKVATENDPPPTKPPKQKGKGRRGGGLPDK